MKTIYYCTMGDLNMTMAKYGAILTMRDGSTGYFNKAGDEIRGVYVQETPTPYRPLGCQPVTSQEEMDRLLAEPAIA